MRRHGGLFKNLSTRKLKDRTCTPLRVDDDANAERVQLYDTLRAIDERHNVRGDQDSVPGMRTDLSAFRQCAYLLSTNMADVAVSAADSADSVQGVFDQRLRECHVLMSVE